MAAVFTRPESSSPQQEFNPDEYRMTVGEHLEDLRRRLVLALAGFMVAAALCLFFGRSHIIPTFTRPLSQTLLKYGLPPQLTTDEVPDVFSAFLKISLISAAAIASPWMAWQFWQFVAAGLYPHERKYVTRYIPLSLSLLVGGMGFVYFFVLPWTLEFFISFSIGVPLKLDFGPDPQPPPAITAPASATTMPAATTAPAGPRSYGPPSYIQVVDGQPRDVKEGQLWYDLRTGRVEAIFGGQVRVIRFSADNLIATEYKLDRYIDLVVNMLITFGLAFQLPLVVLTLVRVGIVDRETLKSSRQYVYFGIAVVSAVITPGDAITTTLLLTGPLVLLYELGIWLAREPRRDATASSGGGGAAA